MPHEAIYRHLRELREHLKPPRGFTYPEISDGTFVIMMSPRPRHQVTASDVRDQLAAQLPEGIGAFEATEIDDIALGKLRIPDIIVTAREAMLTDDPLNPHEILLAIEIVSPSNPANDYEAKSRDYWRWVSSTTSSSTPATAPGPTSGTSTRAKGAPPTATVCTSSRTEPRSPSTPNWHLEARHKRAAALLPQGHDAVARTRR